MEKEEKYYRQQIQDEVITEDFRSLHEEIVNMVIEFCQKHNIEADTFAISADGLRDSISFGVWTPATDSSFIIDEEFVTKFTKKYTPQEYYAEKAAHKPLLFSC